MGTGPQVDRNGSSRLEGSGLAIHLDAPQRLAFTKPGFVCAEPSPDALQAYASSLGSGLNIPNTASAAVANALSTSSGSIGLRTQSITLMRDHLYRICEAAYSGSITDLDVAQLLRRSQDMTLGILAIEQLTGAVVARQVAISTSANADASANLAATQQSLAAAREEERLAKEASSEAEAKQAAQQKVVDAQQGVVNNAQPGPDKDRAEEDLKKEKKQLQLDTDAAIDAKKNYEDAQEITKEIEKNLGKAMATARTAAAGKAELSGGDYSSRVDAATAKDISQAATTIVDKIIFKSHLVDSCISIINKFIDLEIAVGEQIRKTRQMQKENQAWSPEFEDEIKQKFELIKQMQSVRGECLKVLENDIKSKAPAASSTTTQR